MTRGVTPRALGVSLLAILAPLAACQGDGPPDPGDDPASGDRAVEPDAEEAPGPEARQREPRSSGSDIWTRSGLVDQVRAHLPLPEGYPEEWEPGVTGWEEMPVPERFREETAGFPSERALLGAYAVGPREEAGGLGQDVWETTIRLLPDEEEPGRALGAVLRWGYKDDAVEGVDVRLHLEEGEDGWFVAEKERRLRCRRGVTPDHLCA